jgi:pimeloyl-ACP methyl ester carboxylesterase
MLDQHFLYFPQALEPNDWARLSGLPLQDIDLKTSDNIRLHGWWISPSDDHPAGPVLLWCPGNAGNISHRLEHLRPLVREGITVMIFDYRGYGRSGGHPSEQGLYADAEAALEYALKQRGVVPERVVAYGQSLGSAVAAHLASRHPKLAGLILETPFPSVKAAARLLYSGMPVDGLLRAKFDTASSLEQVRVPVLVMHGDRDTILPLSLGEAVYEAAHAPKEWFLIRGADHNDTFIAGGEAYYQALIAFIRRVTAPSLAGVRRFLKPDS